MSCGDRYRSALALENWETTLTGMESWGDGISSPPDRMECGPCHPLRCHLLALEIFPGRVKLATRSCDGCWRMSATASFKERCNRWLEKQRASGTRAVWIALLYDPKARV